MGQLRIDMGKKSICGLIGVTVDGSHMRYRNIDDLPDLVCDNFTHTQGPSIIYRDSF